MFNFTVEYFGKYSSSVQQLTSRGWHQANREKSYQLEEGKEVGDGKRWWVVSNRRGRASCSVTQA